MKSQEGHDGNNGSVSSEKLDALLGGWQAPDPEERGGTSWETRADNIVKAAVSTKGKGSNETLEALLAEPALAREPGEENGVAQPPSRLSAEPASLRPSVAPGDGKRSSLKDLAARASQAGAGRASITPAPPSMRPSVPDMTGSRDSRPSIPASGALASVTPISKARPSAAKTSDAGREDSGVVRLADIQSKQANDAEAKAAAAEAALAAATAKRAEGQAAATAVVAKPTSTSGGTSSSKGVWTGVAVAVLGMAAAFAVYKTRKPDAPPPVAVATQTPVTAAAVATEAPKPQVTAEPTAVASAEPAPAQTAAPVAAADDPKGAAGGSAPASSATAVAMVEPKGIAPQASAKTGSKIGTLEEEMRKAVDPGALPPAPQDDGSKPAAGGGANLPDQPSQGNAQAAVRAVLPAAKACVAGAPEPTTASITFASSGGATSVNVGGWAAANGKAGCVKSALMGARVAPFAKPSFTVPVTVRP